jgi:hypothetical protein
MVNIDPILLAKLLDLRQIEWLPQLGVSPVWARSLAKDPRHSRRVRIAILQAALERETSAQAALQ